MPSATPPLNVGGVQPPYDPISSAAGSIQAVNPANLTITPSGTLGVKSGPTITVSRTLAPMILQSNSVLPTAPLGASLLEINGPPAANGGLTIDTYAANSTFTMRRADGSAGTPSAVAALASEGVFQAFAYNGTAYVANCIIQFIATENQTTLASGGQMNFIAVTTGGTAQVTMLALNGNRAGMITPALQGTTSYANDAAAAAGGVVIGELYRNGSVVQCRIT